MSSTSAFVPPFAASFCSTTAPELSNSTIRRPRFTSAFSFNSLDVTHVASHSIRSTSPLFMKNFHPEGKSNSKRKPQTRQKQNTTLLKALTELKVASQDTCSLLIERSCIQVNGSVVTNEDKMISRANDRIFVNGRDLGTVLGGNDRVDEWEERAPRTHRDRSQGEIDLLRRQFDRHVDEGFYQGKKRSS